ncbi:MAG: hypothetical protein LBB85_12945 [Dysgonamonadaceae bacterium]|nr:hypothetical protein [Dysgonamonadaceae bacterium]
MNPSGVTESKLTLPKQFGGVFLFEATASIVVAFVSRLNQQATSNEVL